MDQDIGSSVIKHISHEHPRIVCMGAKASDCYLSDYSYLYKNGRKGDTIILPSKKYEYSLIIKINIVFYNDSTYQLNKKFFEHCASIRRAPSVTCAK